MELSQKLKELRNKQGLTPVSYTHLDVYKRQVLQSPYSVDFTEEQARYQIHEDLMQHEDGKEWACLLYTSRCV